MKHILFLVDGLADLPQHSLEGHTPLETAVTPSLDDLANEGSIGRIKLPGSRPRTPLGGLLSLLGVAPSAGADHAAGWFFARGDGVAVGASDAVYRMAFVAEADRTVVDPWLDNLTEAEERVLLDIVGGGASGPGVAGKEWKFATGTSGSLYAIHLGGAKHAQKSVLQWLRELRGSKTDDATGGNSPVATIVKTARNALANQQLNMIRIDLGMNPANALWLWGGGSNVQLKPLSERVPLRTGFVSASPMGRGVALALGVPCDELRTVRVPALMESGEKTDMKPVRAAERVLRDSLSEMRTEVRGVLDLCSLAIVHVHCVDAASCRARPDAKRRAIELVDEVLVGPLVGEYSARECRIAVVSTSANDSGTGRDIDLGLPYALWGSDLDGEGGLTLTERNAASVKTVHDSDAFIGAMIGV